jgi:hypothetical protein
MNTKNKQRNELVKLLKQGCPKRGICLILGIDTYKLSTLLAPVRGRNRQVTQKFYDWEER